MTSVEGSNRLSSLPSLRVLPRKMRARVCFITALTSGTISSSCWRKPSSASCLKTPVARFTPFPISAEKRLAYDDVVYLERSANKWPLAPEHFSFFLLEDGRPQFYRLKRDVIDLGGDYTLFSHRNEVVGRLDGKVFTLGGKWRGRVHPDHANPRLLAVLQLFCGMLIFNGSCRRHVRRIARDVRAGRYEPKIEK
jgi:hypothetical protein